MFVCFRFHVDFSKDQLVLGGFRDWGIFTAVELMQLLLFFSTYVTFKVNFYMVDVC